METQQESEVDVLASAVERLSTALADATIENTRLRVALEKIATSEAYTFVGSPRDIARRALLVRVEAHE